MIIDTGITIANRCSACGAFEFYNISIFKMLRKKAHTLKCNCGGSTITIGNKHLEYYNICVNCMGCGEDHVFAVSRKQLLSSHTNVFRCPIKGVEQCFAGNDIDVRRSVDNMEKELDQLIDTFGYDSYFHNTRVMYDTLNRIHDIAEQGNLLCECGNSDIELLLFPDAVCLKCKQCPGSKLISAASNEDLKNIMTGNQVLLLSDYRSYNIACSMDVLKRKSRK